MLIICVIIAVGIGAWTGSPVVGLLVFLCGLASLGDNGKKSHRKRRASDPDYIYYDDL